MSHEPVQDDPYEQLNSDNLEKIKAGLIVLRGRAVAGDQKAGRLLDDLKEAKCPDEPLEAARWVLENRRKVAKIEIFEGDYGGDSGCAPVVILVAGLTFGLWLVG